MQSLEHSIAFTQPDGVRLPASLLCCPPACPPPHRDWCGEAIKQMAVNSSEYNHVMCMALYSQSSAICNSCDASKTACAGTCPASSGISTVCGFRFRVSGFGVEGLGGSGAWVLLVGVCIEMQCCVLQQEGMQCGHSKNVFSGGGGHVWLSSALCAETLVAFAFGGATATQGTRRPYAGSSPPEYVCPVCLCVSVCVCVFTYAGVWVRHMLLCLGRSEQLQPGSRPWRAYRSQCANRHVQ